MVVAAWLLTGLNASELSAGRIGWPGIIGLAVFEYAGTGCLIASRLPRNPIGWLAAGAVAGGRRADRAICPSLEHLSSTRCEADGVDSLLAADPAGDSITAVAYWWGSPTRRFAAYHRSAYDVLPGCTLR